MKTWAFLKNTASTLMTRLVIVSFTALIGIITARTLGPSGLGAFSLALVIPSLVSLFLQFGIGLANVYYIGRRKYPTDVLLGNALTMSLLTSAIVLPLYGLAIPLLLRTVAVGIQPMVLVLVGLTIPLALIGGHLSFIFLGLQDIQEYNRLRLIRDGTTLLFVVILVVVLQTGVIGATAAVAVAWSLMIVRGFWILSRRMQIRLGWAPDALKDCLSLGMKGYLANLFQFFNYRLDVLLVSYFAGITALGLYGTAVTTAEMLWYVPESVATVLFPKTAGSSDEEARTFTPTVTRSVFALTLLSAVLLGLFSYPLITILFGSSYDGSVLALRLLLPGAVLLAVCKVLASDLGGRGLLVYNSLASLAGLLATILLDLVLIPRWSIYGAAVASSISYALSTVVTLIVYTRVSGHRTRDVLVPRREDWDRFVTYGRRVSQLILARGER